MNKDTVFYIQQGNTNSKLKGECIMSWFTDESGSVVGEGSIGGYYGDSYGSYGMTQTASAADTVYPDWKQNHMVPNV
jgi:glycine cleavage system aminomethyltransferase T